MLDAEEGETYDLRLCLTAGNAQRVMSSDPVQRANTLATNSERNDNTSSMGQQVFSTLKFGPFSVASQAFHLSPARVSFALVNLKPLLPGHVLVCPVRCTPRLSQLTPSETADLFVTVRRVSKMIERVFKADALNIAVQDGVEAGQSVPHVHVHIIPRRNGDMDSKGGGDAIYSLMDGEDGNIGKAFAEMQQQRDRRKDRSFVAAPDADRKPRAQEEMAQEAEWLAGEMTKDDDANPSSG